MTDDQNKKGIVAEIEARRLGEGKEIVEASRISAASDGAEKGYAAWVGLDVGDLSRLTEPAERRLALEQIAMNARDFDYRLALEDRWPDLAREVSVIARTLPGQEPESPAPGPEGVAATAKLSKQTVWGPAEWETAARPAKSPLASPVDAVEVTAAVPGTPANEADAHNPANEADGGAQLREARVARAQLSADAQSVLERQRSDDRKEAQAVLQKQHQKPDFAADPADAAAVAATDEENSIEAEGAGINPVLTKDGYELPVALAARYVMKDGKFFLAQALAKDPAPAERGKKAAKQKDVKPAFWDTGARLKSHASDRATVADMVAIAQAKRWTSATVRGTEAFRRNAWQELSLAGIEVKGFQPSERDHLKLQALKQEREALRISAAKDKVPTPQKPSPAVISPAAPAIGTKPQQTTATPATDQQAPPPAFTVGAVRSAYERSIEHHPANVRTELMKRFDAHIRAGIELQGVNKGAELRQAADARFSQQSEAWSMRKGDEVAPQGPDVKQSQKSASPSI